MTAIDTNVFIYAVNDANLDKQKISQDLLTNLVEDKEIVLLWQVAAEFLDFLYKAEKKGSIKAEEI